MADQEQLGKEFEEICRKGDLKEFDQFHKNNCQNKGCSWECFSSDGKTDPVYEEDYGHKEDFWSRGHWCAVKGNNLHILIKLLSMCVFWSDGAEYEVLRNKNINDEIFDFYNGDYLTDVYFNCDTHDKEYLSICEGGSVKKFKALGLNKDLEQILTIGFISKDNAKKGCGIVCENNHSDLMDLIKFSLIKGNFDFECCICKNMISEH